MEAISLIEAERLLKDYPDVFRSQTSEGLGLKLFTYSHPRWSVFRDEPLAKEMRGAIFHLETGRLISLPFPKFFNLGENEESEFPEHVDRFMASEKFDGSLAQLFRLPDGTTRFASRSSLEGYVANSAFSDISPREHETLLFEFLDPDNRIVIRHTEKSLVGLGSRKVAGSFHHDPRVWKEFSHGELKDLLLRLSTMQGTEGLVFSWEEDGETRFLKAKTPWYSSLHGAITDLTTKRVLTAWASNELDDMIGFLYQQGEDDIRMQVMGCGDRVIEILTAAANSALLVADPTTRKSFALSLRGPEHQLVFPSLMAAYKEGTKPSIGDVIQRFRDSLLASRTTFYRLVDLLPPVNGTMLKENL